MPSKRNHGLEGERTVSTIAFGQRVASAAELWDGFLAGSLRMAALVTQQPEESAEAHPRRLRRDREGIQERRRPRAARVRQLGSGRKPEPRHIDRRLVPEAPSRGALTGARSGWQAWARESPGPDNSPRGRRPERSCHARGCADCRRRRLVGSRGGSRAAQRPGLCRGAPSASSSRCRSAGGCGCASSKGTSAASRSRWCRPGARIVPGPRRARERRRPGDARTARRAGRHDGLRVPCSDIAPGGAADGGRPAVRSRVAHVTTASPRSSWRPWTASRRSTPAPTRT